MLKELIKNKFAKETFWSFLTKGVAFLLYFSLNVYLARALRVDEYGAWSFFYSAFTIILVLSYFGINSSAQKYVAQYSGTDSLNNVLKSSAKLRLVFSLAFALLLFLLHRPLARLIGRPDFAQLFLFSAPLILFAGFVELIKNIFMGLHRIKYNFIVSSTEFGLKLLLAVLLLNISFRLTSVLNSFTVAAVITSAVGFYLLYKKFYSKNSSSVGEGFTGEIFRYSLPLFVVGIGFLIATEIDTFMLGLLNTDRQVGIYAVAKQVTGKLPHISLAIAMGTMPVFAKLTRENKSELQKMFYFLLRTNVAIFFSIAAFILLFSRSFIPFIFGAEYMDSVLPLKILTVYLISTSLLISFGAFLNYQGLAWRRARNLSFSMVLNVILNFLLIPRYGALGAASATAVAYLPNVILNWMEVRKAFRSYD
ncbi:flippase [Candidatus Omnitrophota bacterium]